MTDAKRGKKGKKYHCEECDYLTCKKSHWLRHVETIKHKRLTNTYIKNVHFHFCECGKKYQHRQSLHSHKLICKFEKNPDHENFSLKNANNANKMLTNANFQKMSIFEKSEISGCKNLHFCECGRSYKHKSTLSRHKKTCTISIMNETNMVIKTDTNNDDLKEMFIQLMEQNKEILAQNTEIARKPTTNITNNTQFNIMNYLNTECKDAMNLSDFIESFEFSIKDLEMLTSKGYQESMEHTFIKQLCDMEKTKRPIHCSDKKRKSFYIKDNDVWKKDTNNEKLIRGMKNISFVHNNALNKWKNKHEDWNSNETKQMFYCNSILEFSKCDKEKERNKILSKLVNLSIK